MSTEPAAAARVGQKRLPDFFIVGHPKCGTTALYAMLRRHPQIHMPVKEPRFFSPEPSVKQPDTLNDYLSLFANARPEQRVGEATPSYLRSLTAASRIADLQPDARIIAILREPASFLRSFHLQAVRSHVESEKDLRKAIGLDQVRRREKEIPSYSSGPEALPYSEAVQYVEQLRRYHAVFPAEQVLVLIYDDFRQDNEATVRKVLRFLDVDDTAPISVEEANPTVRVRALRLYELVHAVSVARGPVSRSVKATIKTLAPRQLSRESAIAIRDRILFDNPRPPDEGLMRELRRRFKSEVVALSDYLDRDLVTLWGYDDID